MRFPSKSSGHLLVGVLISTLASVARFQWQARPKFISSEKQFFIVKPLFKLFLEDSNQIHQHTKQQPNLSLGLIISLSRFNLAIPFTRSLSLNLISSLLQQVARKQQHLSKMNL